MTDKAITAGGSAISMGLSWGTDVNFGVITTGILGIGMALLTLADQYQRKRTEWEEQRKDSLIAKIEEANAKLAAKDDQINENTRRLEKLEALAERRQEIILEVERQRDEFIRDNGELTEKVFKLSLIALESKGYVIQTTTETQKVAVVHEAPAAVTPPAQATPTEGSEDHARP